MSDPATVGEHPSESGTDFCKSCNQPLAGRYYRVNGSINCERCAAKVIKPSPIDSPSAFARGVLFGIGGAILAALLWVAFQRAVEFAMDLSASKDGSFGILEIAVWLVSVGARLFACLAVGAITGTAIMFGSREACGLRYQIAGAILTTASMLTGLVLDSAHVTKASTLHQLASVFLHPDVYLRGFILLLFSIGAVWRITGVAETDVLGPFTPSDSSTPAAPA